MSDRVHKTLELSLSSVWSENDDLFDLHCKFTVNFRKKEKWNNGKLSLDAV